MRLALLLLRNSSVSLFWTFLLPKFWNAHRPWQCWMFWKREISWWNKMEVLSCLARKLCSSSRVLLAFASRFSTSTFEIFVRDSKAWFNNILKDFEILQKLNQRSNCKLDFHLQYGVWDSKKMFELRTSCEINSMTWIPAKSNFSIFSVKMEYTFARFLTWELILIWFPRFMFMKRRALDNFRKSVDSAKHSLDLLSDINTKGGLIAARPPKRLK